MNKNSLLACSSLIPLIISAQATAADLKQPVEKKPAPSLYSESDAYYRRFIQGISMNYIDINTNYNKRMFDRQNDVTSKLSDQLSARASGELQDMKLYLGAHFSGSLYNETTNSAGRFPVLARQPTGHVNRKFERLYAVNDLSFNATLTLPWLTGFVQEEYTEVFYPGQEPWQLRKWHFTVGDLTKFPVYAFVGQGTVDFGDFRSYSPFVPSFNNHYFWAQSADPMFGVGYMKDGWRATATLLHSGRGARVLDSPRNALYDNFALNAERSMQINDLTSVKVGLGYLNSTSYNNGIGLHPPRGQGGMRNGAIDANISMTYDKIDVAFEYTRSLRDWPATDYPVSAATLQGRYRTTLYTMPTRLYAQAGMGKQGPTGTQWDRMATISAGTEVDLTKNVTLGTEVIHHNGFVPFFRPTLLGRRDVKSNTFIAGTKITF